MAIKKMKRYIVLREGLNNLKEPTLTVIVGNSTFERAEWLVKILVQETSAYYRIQEDDGKLDGEFKRY